MGVIRVSRSTVQRHVGFLLGRMSTGEEKKWKEKKIANEVNIENFQMTRIANSC